MSAKIFVDVSFFEEARLSSFQNETTTTKILADIWCSVLRF
jgi:hypothetical protein